MNAAQTTRKTETVTCPKCEGKGHLAGFAHYANGICFECYGAGTIEVDAMTANEKLDCIAGTLRYTCDIVLDAAYHGNDERASFYLALMLDKMFSIGTTRARKVLDHLAAGRFWDDEEQSELCVSPARARELRAELIALGRARKAA